MLPTSACLFLAQKKSFKEGREHWLKGRCMHECSVAQSFPTLCNPMDCSPPGSSVFFRQGYWRGLSFTYVWRKKKITMKSLMKVYKGSLTAFSMKVLDTRGMSTLSCHSTRPSNLHFKNDNVYMPGVLRCRLWDFLATTRNHDLASPEWEADFL